MGEGVVELEVEKLFIGECNVRREVGDISELVESVKRDGVLEPLIVRPVGDRYEVVAGSRRFRAALAAGLRRVPCIVRKLSDEEAILLSLIENVQRSDLTPREVAEAYFRLRRLNPSRWTQTEFARAIKKSPSWVTSMLLAMQSLQRFKGVVEDVKPRPTEEEKKAGIVPIEYMVELERAVRAVERSGQLPKEVLEERARELARATKNLTLEEAKAVFRAFELHPEKPIEELMKLAGVSAVPTKRLVEPSLPMGGRAAEAAEGVGVPSGEVPRGEIEETPEDAERRLERGREGTEEGRGETPEGERAPSPEEVPVEYVVGVVRCPECGAKLELIHREPRGHRVREVEDA